MYVIKTFLVVLCLMWCMPAHAHICVLNPAPGVPSGEIATQPEMVAARVLLDNHIVETREYQKCLQDHKITGWEELSVNADNKLAELMTKFDHEFRIFSGENHESK